MCRLPNDTYFGMLSEVRDQYVDISTAAYGWTTERNTLVDFTRGIAFSTITLLIRRPSKHDLSFRYFFLGMLIFLSDILYILYTMENRISYNLLGNMTY